MLAGFNEAEVDGQRRVGQATCAPLAAFQVGRLVFADSDGVLRYDGDCEPVTDDAGPSKTDLAAVKRPWWRRVWLTRDQFRETTTAKNSLHA